MKVQTAIISVVLFIIVVTGQENRPCASLRCYISVNCDWEPNHRCCLCQHNGRCYYNRRWYSENEEMPSDDVCSQCYCRNGKRDCGPIMCAACIGPIRPGECCPDCAVIG